MRQECWNMCKKTEIEVDLAVVKVAAAASSNPQKSYNRGQTSCSDEFKEELFNTFPHPTYVSIRAESFKVALLII